MCCLASCCWDVNKCWAAGFTGMFRLYYLFLASDFTSARGGLLVPSRMQSFNVVVWLLETLACFGTVNMKSSKLFYYNCLC
jgi:hypothetical protein